MENYETLTYKEAVALLENRFNPKNPVLPPKEEIKERRELDAGNHWRGGKGYIGQMPTGEYAGERTRMLQKAFSPEDVIPEVLDTHIQNVLGEDVVIELESDLPETEIATTLEIVKDWYDKRKLTDVFADGLRGGRREKSRLLRVFIPSGMIDGDGGIEARDLEEALSKIWIRSEPIESGGVLVDEETAAEIGLFLYRMKVDKQDVSLCEKSYLQEIDDSLITANNRLAEFRGQMATMWGTVSAHNQNAGAEEAEPFLLNGLLPIYQLNIEPFISPAVCAAQRAINLAGTMFTKNVNYAGELERYALNVQPPGKYVDTGETNEQGEPIQEFEPTEIKTGAGMMHFFRGADFFDPLTKSITPAGNPNLVFREPVEIDTFVGTLEYWRQVIYAKAKQLHILAANDGRLNGISRIQMRKEFEASLQESASVINPAAEWAIMTALHIAAHFIKQKGKFLNTKVVCKAQVATVELTAEERTQIVAEYKANLIDLRTALEQLQYKNVDEIIERLEGKAEGGQVPNADVPANGDAELVQ